MSLELRKFIIKSFAAKGSAPDSVIKEQEKICNKTWRTKPLMILRSRSQSLSSLDKRPGINIQPDLEQEQTRSREKSTRMFETKQSYSCPSSPVMSRAASKGNSRTNSMEDLDNSNWDFEKLALGNMGHMSVLID